MLCDKTGFPGLVFAHWEVHPSLKALGKVSCGRAQLICELYQHYKQEPVRRPKKTRLLLAMESFQARAVAIYWIFRPGMALAEVHSKGLCLARQTGVTTMHKHLWPLAALPLAAAAPALAYDVEVDQPQQQQQHTDWAYTDDASSPDALHYRPFHYQISGGPVITQKSTSDDLSGGWNAGAGFTWYPTRYIPFGVRVDGSYSRFDATQSLLSQAASAAGTQVNSGAVERYGGDVDGEIDVPINSFARFYLLGGVGWYKTSYSYRQEQLNETTFCGWFGCESGFVHSDPVVANSTTQWQLAKNAGFGFEFSMGPGASFFMEARYMRIGSAATRQDFIPIRFGLRF